jgi:carbamoyltransferase
VFPSLKEEYYLLRRRKKAPGPLDHGKKLSKYVLTRLGPNALAGRVSSRVIKRELARLGFRNFQLHLVKHHLCHACDAAFCSGFPRCLVLTLDGIGDGLSGTVSVFADGELQLLTAISGRDSLGIFFEHVTTLLNMRELEDEGKVMALADYAYPVPDRENPLLDFFAIEGQSVRAKYASVRMYRELKKILWRYASEQFAYMAQRTLEVKILELVQNAIRHTGEHRLAIAGGVASNIKVNRLLRLLPEVEDCFIFPHMGDGGLPLGAALGVNHRLQRVSAYELKDLYLGPQYSEASVRAALERAHLQYVYSPNIEEEVAKLIAGGEIVFWFQGRMELGPRALGARSILALPDSLQIKDELNVRLKKRVWYQPFCPTMLEEDAWRYLEDYDGKPNPFMTMAYMTKKELRDGLCGVISVDGSCRPQILTGRESRYERLLAEVKRLTGKGIILNTSFNVHSEPIVCAPEHAIDTMLKTNTRYLAIGDFLVCRTS